MVEIRLCDSGILVARSYSARQAVRDGSLGLPNRRDDADLCPSGKERMARLVRLVESQRLNLVRC
jgi:hypothetical protein